MENIKIHFVSLDHNLPNVCKEIFGNNPSISCSVENITKCSPHDCIVSPANSFGFMDGGIDAALSRMLEKGYDIEFIGRKVRKVIKDEYYGEQPVGTCILLETENKDFPFLAHSPTMTTPDIVVGTLNAYYAFKAVLCSVINHNKKSKRKITTILTTTFCTGCGKMSLETSLKQMKYAYEVVKNGIEGTWANANKHSLNLHNLKQ